MVGHARGLLCLFHPDRSPSGDSCSNSWWRAPPMGSSARPARSSRTTPARRASTPQTPCHLYQPSVQVP